MRTVETRGGTSFAERSLSIHLVRGVAGFGLLAGSFALIPVVGLLSLLLLPVGLLALRGCPLCWVMGLAEVVSRGRVERSCADGRCRVTPRRAPAGEGGSRPPS
ncbi:hypothetical protein [Nonomuraea candida]|uniref:hypothetical protein n=1 Tax=Nonomuraea candida TaxID=359159 RepID=UPI0005BA4D1E|nr:hypothetical protein [Nonomuraea candida]